MIKSVSLERKSDSLVKKSKSLPLFFCHERPEPIAHGCSFRKSDKSKSLPVGLLFRATEQFADGHSCHERPERIPNPAKSVHSQEFECVLVLYLAPLKKNYKINFRFYQCAPHFVFLCAKFDQTVCKPTTIGLGEKCLTPRPSGVR